MLRLVCKEEKYQVVLQKEILRWLHDLQEAQGLHTRQIIVNVNSASSASLVPHDTYALQEQLRLAHSEPRTFAAPPPPTFAPIRTPAGSVLSYPSSPQSMSTQTQMTYASLNAMMGESIRQGKRPEGASRRGPASAGVDSKFSQRDNARNLRQQAGIPHPGKRLHSSPPSSLATESVFSGQLSSGVHVGQARRLNADAPVWVQPDASMASSGRTVVYPQEAARRAAATTAAATAARTAARRAAAIRRDTPGPSRRTPRPSRTGKTGPSGVHEDEAFK